MRPLCRGSTASDGAPLSKATPPPPLCHGRHHSHILLMEWSALRVILMSRFIRATMHAGLLMPPNMFFFFTHPVLSLHTPPPPSLQPTTSLSPHYVCLLFESPPSSPISLVLLFMYIGYSVTWFDLELLSQYSKLYIYQTDDTAEMRLCGKRTSKELLLVWSGQRPQETSQSGWNVSICQPDTSSQAI